MIQKRFSFRRSIALASGIIASAMLGGIASGQTLQQIAVSESARFYQNYHEAELFASLNSVPMTINTPGGGVIKFIGMEHGRPIYISTFDMDANRTLSVQKVWPGGASSLALTGSSQTIGIWDDGIPQHPEIDSRVTNQDPAASTGFHCTNVTTSMGATGLNANAKGVAYQAHFWNYDFGNDNAEMATAVQNGLRISNHSYGYPNGWQFGIIDGQHWAWLGDPAISATEDYTMGFYGDHAKAWDQLMYAGPNHLMIISAGNQRLEGPGNQPEDHHEFVNGAWTIVQTTRDLDGGPNGYDSLPEGQTCKNGLISGATLKNGGGYQGPNSVIMSGFSCWGPTNDGRIKPDCVAPGVSIFLGETGGGYGFADGTSFSAPITTGVVALMSEHYQNVFNATPNAAMLRNIIDIGCDEAGSNVGPDYAFGWGQVNADKSAAIITQGAFNPDLVQARTINTGQTYTLPLNVAPGGDIRVSIAWTDPAGPTFPAASNARTAALINDLDLRLIRNSDGQVFLPWKLDPANPATAATKGDNTVDNIEVIDIANPTPGGYTLRVTSKGTLRPSGSQDYSLLVSAPISGGIDSLILAPSSVTGGLENSTGTITLAANATQPEVINLTTSHPNIITIPGSVTVPTGSKIATFPIITRSVLDTTTVTIFAGGQIGATSARLTVRPVTVVGPLELVPGKIGGGNWVNAVVHLNGPAPAGGASVYVSSTNSTYAEPERNWLLIPAGQSSLAFRVRTFPVSDNQQVFIRATRGGVTVFNDLTIQRAALSSLTTSQSTNVLGGTTIRATVRLDAPAQAGGSIVQLSSSNRAVADCATSVTIPAGQREADFNIITRPQGTTKTATITASRFGVNKTLNVTVHP